MSEAEKLARTNGKNDPGLEVVDLEKFQDHAKDQRLSVLKTYKIYIDGKFPRTESGRYYVAKSPKGELLANVCLSSRKDFRNAVVAARKAFPGWAEKSAFNRGQIIYRIAEMLEGRREQFIAELVQEGLSRRDAEQECDCAVDRLVYYSGWADKYQQIFSAVNPVNTSHFNFSMLEPMGVVAIAAPEERGLLGLVSALIPVITGGNTCIVLASHSRPLCSVTFAEVLNSSDVPGGVVNILTGTGSEIIPQFASHMDVNAVLYCGKDEKTIQSIQAESSSNIKRTIICRHENWLADDAQSPYAISDFQETKTTWHPVGI